MFDSVVFATGSRDGHIMIWDRRTKSKGTSFTQPCNVHWCLKRDIFTYLFVCEIDDLF